MNEATADYIRMNGDGDVRQLALRGTKDPDVDLPFALNQIMGRQMAQRKLPTWAATEGIVYPPHLSMEQCSSEQTARYKERRCGDGGIRAHRTLVDLTGGFGVDFSFMAQGFERAVYVECQEKLCAIAKENFRLLGLTQAEVVCCDAEEYLRQMSPVDLVYIDPARRDEHGARTYGISDCTPDVVAMLPLLLQKAKTVLLKLSPMLDWRKAVSDIGEQYVREVHIVAVGNECKELLLLLSQGDSFSLACVNDNSIWCTSPDPTTPIVVSPKVTVGQWLFEPNAAMMKAGCFGQLSQQYGVSAIAPNSHLFVSERLISDFPGRVFGIDAITTLNKRELKQHLGGLSQANITVRNFPLSVAELRRRLKLSEGGSTYIFATTLADGSHVLLITRRPCTEPQSR